MQNAVIYARYSSDHQREESIDGQIRECKAFAERNGYCITATYIDRAMSAKTDNRPDFRRMIKDSATKNFDFVIVYTLDRFARNRYDSATYKMQLKRNGVKVLSAKENITDDPTGIILESMLEGMAEYYSAELAQKVKRGMTENALACKWASGRVPFGYRVGIDKHLEIEPAHAELVRKLFTGYAKGETVADLIAMANETGIRNHTNRRFSRNSFSKMFALEIYIGTFKWGDVRVEGGCPAIIDKDTFQKCQKRLAERKPKNQGAHRSKEYFLSSKLICGECGGNMVGQSAIDRHKKKHQYYACYNTHAKLCSCSLGNVPKNTLEDVVIEGTKQLLRNEEALNYIADMVINCAKAEIKEADTGIDDVAAQIRDVEKKLENCMQAIENGIFSPTIAQRVNDYEKQLVTLKDLKETKILYKNTFRIEKKHVLFFLTKWEAMTGDEAKEYIISSLVDKAIVNKKEDGTFTATIQYNYTANEKLPNTTTLELKSSIEEPELTNVSSNDAQWWTIGSVSQKPSIYPIIFNRKFIVKFAFERTTKLV